MKFALGSSDISNMEWLIARANKLSETLKMSHSRAPHPQYYDRRKMEPDWRIEPDCSTWSFFRGRSAHKPDSSRQPVHKKFEVYIALMAGREQILNVIANESILKPPHPLKLGPNVDKTRYCFFHKDYSHIGIIHFFRVLFVLGISLGPQAHVDIEN